MASTYGFTTADKVKERLKNYNTSATTAQIETFINHAEGLIITASEKKWSGTIPPLVESIATDLAALYLLANDPSGFTNIVEAGFIADVLWASSRRNLQVLMDKRRHKLMEKNP